MDCKRCLAGTWDFHISGGEPESMCQDCKNSLGRLTKFFRGK